MLATLADAAAAAIDREPLAPLPDAATHAEVVPIADGQLRAWTRPPAPVTAPRVETVERDDRRWLWVAVLVLLAVETVDAPRAARRRATRSIRRTARVA